MPPVRVSLRQPHNTSSSQQPFCRPNFQSSDNGPANGVFQVASSRPLDRRVHGAPCPAEASAHAKHAHPNTALFGDHCRLLPSPGVGRFIRGQQCRSGFQPPLQSMRMVTRNQTKRGKVPSEGASLHVSLGRRSARPESEPLTVSGGEVGLAMIHAAPEAPHFDLHRVKLPIV